MSSTPSPTRIRPLSTAIVAGSAPVSLTAASISSAVSRLTGRGKPCAMTADSSATTARPAARAAATRGAMSRNAFTAVTIDPAGGMGDRNPGFLAQCGDMDGLDSGRGPGVEQNKNI